MIVNLTFRGLCALVPDEPVLFPGEQDISGLTVLLPDARQAGQVGSLPICAHTPKAIFDRPNGPDETWILDRERIEIVPRGAPAGNPAAGLGTRQVKIHGSAADIAHVKRAAPEAGSLKQDLLQDPASSALLVASVPLTAGTLHGIEKSPQVLEFRISPEIPGTYRGRFARAVQVLIEIPGNEAELRATRFDGGPPRREPEILTPKSGRSSVDVTISNLCRDAEELAANGQFLVKASASSEKEKPPHPLDEDADFALFYGLLDKFDGPPPLPTPLTGQDHKGAGDEVLGEATRGAGCVPAFI